jgi:hypothetical protein
MTTTPKMGQKLEIYKIWPQRFAQKNIYRIVNLSKTINELISPNFFLSKYRFLKKKHVLCRNLLMNFFFSITFDPNNRNTSMISFWKGL